MKLSCSYFNSASSAINEFNENARSANRDSGNYDFKDQAIPSSHLSIALTRGNTASKISRVFVNPAERSEKHKATYDLAFKQTFAARKLLYSPGTILCQEIVQAASVLHDIVKDLADSELRILTCMDFGAGGFLPGTHSNELRNILNRLVDGSSATAADRTAFISIMTNLGDMYFSFARKKGEGGNLERKKFLRRFLEIVASKGFPALSIEDIDKVRLAADGDGMAPKKRLEQPEKTIEERKIKKNPSLCPPRAGVHNLGDKTDEALGIPKDMRIPKVRWLLGRVAEERVANTTEPFVDHMSGRIGKTLLVWDMLRGENPGDSYGNSIHAQRYTAMQNFCNAGSTKNPQPAHRKARLARAAGAAAIIVGGGFHSALEIIGGVLIYLGQDVRSVLLQEQDPGHLFGHGAATDIVVELFSEQSAQPQTAPI
jgi:hypothetical protein